VHVRSTCTHCRLIGGENGKEKRLTVPCNSHTNANSHTHTHTHTNTLSHCTAGWNDMLDRRHERECMYAESITRILGGGDRPQKDNKIYLYSTQSLNFKGLAMKEMRERLGKVKGATYLVDIVCLSVCLSVYLPDSMSVCLSVCLPA
jgi:hypothetical protein